MTSSLSIIMTIVFKIFFLSLTITYRTFDLSTSFVYTEDLHPSLHCMLAFAWWLLCSSRILPSKVSFEISLPTKSLHLKHHNKKLLCIECGAFSEDSTSFPGMCYFIDYWHSARTVRNFARRAKLISSVFKKR